MAGPGDADDQGALGSFDDLVGDGVEFVDLRHAPNLWEVAFEQPQVAARDPHGGGDRLGVGEVVVVECLAGGAAVSLQDEQEFVLAQGSVLMGEPDTAVDLGVG